MPTPTWQAPATGSAPLAAHVNQFLGVHASTELYAATQRSGQTTAGTGGTSTNGTWLAQSFTTASGQSAIGYVQVNLGTPTALGSNLPPLTLSIYASSAGAPSGAALSSTTVTTEYVNAAAAPVLVPVALTGLAANTTYWVVIPAVGNASFSYSWNKSNQASGASTSSNGTTWTAQAYGFRYQVFDETAAGNLVATWEDAGARWTAVTYNANGTIRTLAEYTAGQTTPGYLQSFRTLTYSGGSLTGVS